MRIPAITGPYVGLGLGDSSEEIRKIKGFMRIWYNSYAGNLPDTPHFDLQMEYTVKEMQNRLVNSGRLKQAEFLPGVINKRVKEVMGYLKYLGENEILPMAFSINGHLSDMNVGPASFLGQVLEEEKRAIHRPTGYNNSKIPFDNKSGEDEIIQRLDTKVFDDGKKFPEGTPWYLLIHSQGAMIGCKVMRDHVLPENGRLHYRLKDFRKGVALGNPVRELNSIAPWVPDPPAVDTQGIMDWHFEAGKYPELTGKWMEHARAKDWYAENKLDEIGMNMTAIAKIITENKWSGGPAGLVARIIDLFGNPFDGFYDIVWAMVRTVMGVSNLRVHNEYDLDPVLRWLREV